MPRIKSAKKRLRTSLKSRARNKPIRSATKTYLTKAEKLISIKDMDAAAEAVRQATKALDKAAQKGIIHINNAARHKSRLMKKYNAAKVLLTNG